MSAYTMLDEQYNERRRKISDLHCDVVVDGLPPIMRTVLVGFVRDGGWTLTLAFIDPLGKWIDSGGIGIDEPIDVWWALPMIPKIADASTRA